LSDPDRNTLLIGGHESAGALTLSRDGGQTWGPLGEGLPDDSNCTFPLILDTQTFLVGCGGYGETSTGIYRSTNGGKSWKQVSNMGVAGAPLRASDGTLYWVGTDGTLTRSEDDGVNWVDAIGGGTLVGPNVIELPDGRLAGLAKQYVLVSSDQGASWVDASSALPYSEAAPASGLVYSKEQKAFFIWHFSCGFDGPVPVPDDAIMRYDFDYEAS